MYGTTIISESLPIDILKYNIIQTYVSDRECSWQISRNKIEFLEKGQSLLRDDSNSRVSEKIVHRRTCWKQIAE